jgi:excisionase family DNA binding protein
VDKLLSSQQVADHLGMHVKTLYKLLRENKLALNFIRVHGRTIAFRPSDVELFLGSHEVIRDGSSLKNKKRKATPSRQITAHIMTDEEAQDFFRGVTARVGEHTGGKAEFTQDS